MNFIFVEYWEGQYVGRKERQRKKTFVIFCEGKTEYNYFSAMTPANVDIVLKPINMQGGGYKSFLDSVKKNGSINRLCTIQNIQAEIQLDTLKTFLNLKICRILKSMLKFINSY